jgi:hypothetical protein
MLPGKKEQREIKPILGNIPAFLNYPINFYFNVEALSARSRRLSSSNTASDVDPYRARLAATESRAYVFLISNTCWALSSMPKILRDTQKDCGKSGCLNDNRIQVLARGD